MVGSRKSGRLALVVALGLLFALTFGALLAVTLWADAASSARVKDVLQLLLTAEAVGLGLAAAWWLAVP